MPDHATRSDGGDSPPHPTMVIVKRAASVVLFLAATFIVVWFLTAPSPEKLLENARNAMIQGDFALAENLAGQAVEKDPQLVMGYVVAGESAAMQEGGRQRAAEYLMRVYRNGGDEPLDLLYHSGYLLVQLGYATAGEKHLRAVIERDPDMIVARFHMLLLLRLEGHNWEIRSQLSKFVSLLLDAGEEIPESLVKQLIFILRPASNIEWVWLEEHELELIEQFQLTDPENQGSQLGKARMDLNANDRASAERILRGIIEADPRQLEAQAQWGLLLSQTNLIEQPNRLQLWHKWIENLPENAATHPEIWVAKGIAARKFGQNSAALRCFWEALRIEPEHRLANYQLSQLLAATGQTDLAREFSDKADRLSKLEYLIKEVGAETERIREIADMMVELERFWEAAAWYRLAIETFPDARWPIAGLERIRRSLENDPPLSISGMNLVLKLDYSTSPLPDWNLPPQNPTTDTTTDTTAIPTDVRFEDLAQQLGLRFQHANGAMPDDDNARMFEFSGGGVAILDYDGDHWPDIYLTQGGSWPAITDDGTHENKIYRNLSSERFLDITTAAGTAGADFSQGATVGDYNNDGFPDIYVSNIGENRLYENNGDGTFTDVTEFADVAGNAWTLSAALADLNGDALPDLYVVNYLGGPDVFERVCKKNDHPIQCDPPMFPAEQDQLYLNLGDGRFENVTDESGIIAADGKGMGIIVADFRDIGKLDLFIANDTTPNFLFINQTDSPGSTPRFTEEGILRGVALDANGQAQSSMGIAVGDGNGDERLDLFVTNFTRESNNFYSEQADHTFVDTTREMNLYDSGFQLMGWGTQFLDADLDGRLDLVVANGALEDLTGVGEESLMPIKFYRNVDNRRFDEIDAGQLGNYFEKKLLGRAIATLDWNRDGLDDFCATHVDVPTALLVNQTAMHGHFLSLTLRGVQSSRDPIGAKVRVKLGDTMLVRQLTAGDGFEASNQRRLTIGMGDRESVDELTITWPSGLEQRFELIAGNRELLAIEGDDELHHLVK